jgi:hypothetical protein
VGTAFEGDEMKLSICRKSERGNTMVEFALVMPFWVALLFGTIAMGVNLTRSIQVVQTSRDLGSMYARGTDFSALGFENLVTGGGTPPSASLVQGMDLSATSTNAVIYLSKVRNVLSTDADCIGGTCGNANKYVFVNRIVFGNPALFTSILGNMTDTSDLDSQKNAKNPTTYAGDRTNQAALFSSAMPGNGAVAYVVEVYMSSPEIAFLGFSGAGNYSRAVF